MCAALRLELIADVHKNSALWRDKQPELKQLELQMLQHLHRQQYGVGAEVNRKFPLKRQSVVQSLQLTDHIFVVPGGCLNGCPEWLAPGDNGGSGILQRVRASHNIYNKPQYDFVSVAQPADPSARKVGAQPARRYAQLRLLFSATVPTKLAPPIYRSGSGLLTKVEFALIRWFSEAPLPANKVDWLAADHACVRIEPAVDKDGDDLYQVMPFSEITSRVCVLPKGVDEPRVMHVSNLLSDRDMTVGDMY